nr:PREDICTED: uncharacterized protein LOC107397820 isoform X1 [Tribolium castaneum]|eukprot:XP_015834892.1 PREDICTED: uncharacterized protein LOC107397820 isoform X1 [Tribolium castaneum]
MGSKSASGAVKKGDVNKMADFLCKTTPFWGERLDDGSAKARIWRQRLLQLSRIWFALQLTLSDTLTQSGDNSVPITNLDMGKLRWKAKRIIGRAEKCTEQEAVTNVLQVSKSTFQFYRTGRGTSRARSNVSYTPFGNLFPLSLILCKFS